MQKMGYGDQPYIAYKHGDTHNTHIHIVSVCVDEEGRKINDSFEHRRSMTACRELETDFGLRNSADMGRTEPESGIKEGKYVRGRHTASDKQHPKSCIRKLPLPDIRGIQRGIVYLQY